MCDWSGAATWSVPRARFQTRAKLCSSSSCISRCTPQEMSSQNTDFWPHFAERLKYFSSSSVCIPCKCNYSFQEWFQVLIFGRTKFMAEQRWSHCSCPLSQSSVVLHLRKESWDSICRRESGHNNMEALSNCCRKCAQSPSVHNKWPLVTAIRNFTSVSQNGTQYCMDLVR